MPETKSTLEIAEDPPITDQIVSVPSQNGNGHMAELVTIRNGHSPPLSAAETAPDTTRRELMGDARNIPLADCSVDLVATSPPYWRKRDYGVEDQIG